MFAENRKISLRQLQVLLLLDGFGTAVLFLPAELAQISGRSCWILALVGGLFFGGAAFLVASIGGEMPEATAVEWFRHCFGNGLGTGALLGLGAALLFSGALELRLLSEVVCRSMLPNTPVWVLSLVVLLVSGLLAAQGTECRGRSGEILFFVVVLPLAVILLAVAVSLEYGRLLPLELPAFGELGQGISAVSVVFPGLLFLYFVFPDLRKPTMARAAVWKSMLVTAILLTFIMFLCLAVYGEGLLSEKLLPTLQMMERVSFTGIFLTRQDILILWFWMASAVIFLSGVLYYGVLLCLQMFHQEKLRQKNWLWGWLAMIFGLSLLPENLSAAYHLRLAVLPWFLLVYLVILPLILFFLVKKKGGKEVA